jgi:DNA-binding transcriptional ArsR family regulator
MTYQKVLCALADPTRQAIVDALRLTPQPVSALAHKLPISRPAVSQHLKILNDAGLVHVSPRGNRRYYSLAPDGFQSLRRYLDRLWDDALSNFAQEASKLARKDTS